MCVCVCVCVYVCVYTCRCGRFRERCRGCSYAGVVQLQQTHFTCFTTCFTSAFRTAAASLSRQQRQVLSLLELRAQKCK